MNECSVCLCYFEKPRILYCGHTFCEKCIEKTIKNNKLKCPECRRIYRDVRVDSFAINFKLSEAIQENKRILEENRKLETSKDSPNLNRTFSSIRNHISGPKSNAKNYSNFRSTRYNTEHLNEIPEINSPYIQPTIQTRQKTEYLKIHIISKRLFVLSLLYCVPALILALSGLAFNSNFEECTSYLRYWHFSWCGSHLFIILLFVINSALENYKKTDLKILKKIFNVSVFLIFLWTFVGIYWASDKCTRDNLQDKQELMLIIIVSLDFFFNFILFGYNLYIYIKRLLYERRAEKI
ncbi:hypothetical protein SteCoe_27817 [Stentor coeruleus]|uniref:RING-type domain-containing protein n=1 Tax=Stentor coeruleus TaxID=5963 RepID=A0A1R2B9P2_9CILI|nr:hypothetical protein SteCoe_27817 [Stentor coeruleus]